jgi:hypothetical protein
MKWRGVICSLHGMEAEATSFVLSLSPALAEKGP